MKSTDLLLVMNIFTLAQENTLFRKEITTGTHSQVVLMALKPGEDIGAEVHHNLDQILVIVSGSGTAMLNNAKHTLETGSLVFVPAGTKHNIIAGNMPMKLFTIYSPPEHKPGTEHATKQEAEKAHK